MMCGCWRHGRASAEASGTAPVLVIFGVIVEVSGLTWPRRQERPAFFIGQLGRDQAVGAAPPVGLAPALIR